MMVNYLYYGDGVLDYITRSGGWILSVIIALVGIGLIIAAVRDLWAGLAPANKDMKKAGIGLAVGILGGLLLAWSATGIKEFFTGLGGNVPH